MFFFRYITDLQEGLSLGLPGGTITCLQESPASSTRSKKSYVSKSSTGSGSTVKLGSSMTIAVDYVQQYQQTLQTSGTSLHLIFLNAGVVCVWNVAVAFFHRNTDELRKAEILKDLCRAWPDQ